MTNPVDEFLFEKRSFGLGSITGAARGLAGGRVGNAATAALGMGAGAAAFGALAMGGHKAYLAATKTRDFNSMMEANPDLREHNKGDPAGFNRLFTSLRTFAPEFTRDPMVAGAYMRRGMESPVENRGMLGVEAMGAMREQRQHPVVQEAMGGFREGMKAKGPEKKLLSQRKTHFTPGSGDQVIEQVEDTQNQYG
jgi:hypothetical protein